MPATYVIARSKNDQFFFNLIAANAEVILTSEMYVTKQGAERGIESCRKNSPLDERYVRFINMAGQPQFTLKAANGEVIGNSEPYSSVQARERGIESCKVNGPVAIVVDKT